MFAIGFDELCFSLNGSVFYKMDSEANASSALGCDNDDTARGIVRSPARLHATNIERTRRR